jgi:hypothetical protein
MPITSEGSQTITVFDESGNGASTSYFTEFGFGTIAEQLEDLEGRLDEVGSSGDAPSDDAGRRLQECRARREADPVPSVDRLASALAALTLGSALPGPLLAQDDATAYEPPHDRPGPAAERLLYNSFFVDRAPLDIEADNMDLYLFGLKTEAAEELRGTEGDELIDAPATTVSLILNPHPPPRRGQLSPSPRSVGPCSTREPRSMQTSTRAPRPMQPRSPPTPT